MTEIENNQYNNTKQQAEKSISSYEWQRENCVVCSEVHYQTNIDEFRTFMQKFGAIIDIWLEESNGKESRQALIQYAKLEGIKNAIADKYRILKGNFVLIEQSNSQLIKMANNLFLLIQLDNDKQEQMRLAMNLTKQRVIDEISNLLNQINRVRQQEKQKNGSWPSLSGNELLIIKFACEIISYIITNTVMLVPTSIYEEFRVRNFSLELIQFINSIPVHSVNMNITKLLIILTNEEKDELKRELIKQKSLQVLSQLLQHSNIQVKFDSISIMINIIRMNEDRNTRKQSHPLLKEMNQDGVVYSVQQNCLVNGETDEIKIRSAMFLGILYRGHEIKPNRRRVLIDLLKVGVLKDENTKNISEILRILVDLSLNQSNKADIVSNDFLQYICKLTQSDIQSIILNAFELLMNLIDNGGQQIENEIRDIVGIHGFMELIGANNINENIGSLDEYLTENALKRTINWDQNNKQLEQISQLKQIMLNIRQTNDESNFTILNKDFISNIIELLRNSNYQLIYSLNQKQSVSQLTIGTLNYCCYALCQCIDIGYKYVIKLIESDIPNQLINMLNHLPLHDCKQIHILPFFHFSNITIPWYQQILFELGVVQSLIRIINHPNSEMQEKVIQSIYNIINSGSFYVSYKSECFLSNPFDLFHPYYDQLRNDGTLNLLQNYITDDDNQYKNKLLVSYILSDIYKGRAIPQLILQSIFNDLDISCLTNSSIYQPLYKELHSLQLISLNASNQLIILNSEIITTLMKQANITPELLFRKIYKLFNIIIENGSNNTRKCIESTLFYEYLNQQIIRRNQFDASYNKRDQLFEYLQEQKYKDTKFNRKLFVLQAWYKENDKMDKIIKIKQEILELYKDNNDNIQKNELNKKKQQLKQKCEQKDDSQTQIVKYNPQYQVENKDNMQYNTNQNEEQNGFIKIQQIINIINEIKDIELVHGAMKIVRDSVYVILYETIKNKKQQQTIQQLQSFLQLIDGNELEICYYMIDSRIFKSLNFIIHECDSNNQQQLIIKEKTISVLASLAFKGSQISNNGQINILFQFMKKTGLIQTMQIEFKQTGNVVNNDQNEQLNKLSENIQLQTIVYCCCMNKSYENNNEIFNFCENILYNELIKYNNKLNPKHYFDENEQQQQEQLNKEINNIEIYMIRKVIVSIYCLADYTPNAQLLYNNRKIFELIIALFHINCSCSLNIPLINRQIASDILELIYKALINIINKQNKQEIDKLNNKHNIFEHLSSFILSNIQSTPNYTSLKEYLLQIQSQKIKLEYPKLFAETLHFLYMMTCNSKQFMKQICSSHQLIDNLLEIIKCNEIINIKLINQQQIKNICLATIHAICSQINLDLFNHFIRDQNIIQLTINLLSVGGRIRSDYDNVISYSFGILIQMYNTINVNQYQFPNEIQLMKDDIVERMEEEGLKEDGDVLMFHSFRRGRINVLSIASYFKLNVLI